LPALRDQVGAALTSARYAGWEGLVREQRQYLDGFWDAADVQLDGDPEIQQAVRFALFHVLQAGARAENRSIPAKGLSGPGYDGHTFWDTEMFMVPALTYTQPAVVTHVLRWRHSTLDLARERAHTLGLRGAAFPWRTVRGQECSAYWPAGTAAFHNNAAIADAVIRYVNATATRSSTGTSGWNCSSETARLWRSLGHHDRHGTFHIDGVTGPDEYTAVVKDNLYTNVMAQRNLMAAGRRRRPAPGEGRASSASPTKRSRSGRSPRRPCTSPTTRNYGSTSSATASPGCRSGTSRGRRRRSTRCCCTSRTSTSTARRSSSSPTW
jgi:alpha,alpha-trehalose phosphorylase